MKNKKKKKKRKYMIPTRMFEHMIEGRDVLNCFDFLPLGPGMLTLVERITL